MENRKVPPQQLPVMLPPQHIDCWLNCVAGQRRHMHSPPPLQLTQLAETQDVEQGVHVRF